MICYFRGGVHMPRLKKTESEKAEDLAHKEQEQFRAVKAGKDLERMRKELGPTQAEVEWQTRKLGFEVEQQSISKLERGAIEKPSMRDLVALGRVYGRTPNEMAQLYGYWEGEKVEKETPVTKVVVQLQLILSRLKPKQREYAIRTITDLTESYRRRLLEG
jgi:transcriptional regulator with XRE-family HTH domain